MKRPFKESLRRHAIALIALPIVLAAGVLDRVDDLVFDGAYKRWLYDVWERA